MAALSPSTRSHLSKVYAVAALLLAIWGASAAFAVVQKVQLGVPAFVSMLALAIAFAIARACKAHVFVQLLFASLLAASSGMFLERAIDQAIDVDPSIVSSALVGTAIIYASFTLVAFFASDAFSLALAGFASSLSLLMLYAIVSCLLFMPTPLDEAALLYGGLAICSCYVAIDTRALIERIECRGSADENDVIADALTLFYDFVRIFVRLLHLLSKKKSDESRPAKEAHVPHAARRVLRSGEL